MSRKAIAPLLIALLLSNGAGAADSGVIAGVEVGFAGAYKAGLWTPVRVRFASGADLGGAQVSLTVPDGDGVPSRVSAPLPSPAPASMVLCVRFGRIRCPLTVRVERSGSLLAERTFEASDEPRDKTIPVALHSDQPLVVVIGTASLGIGDAIAQMRESAEKQTKLVELGNATDLPEQWFAYEGVSLMVLSGTDPECYSGLSSDDARIEAIARWVRHGGRLLIAAGQHGDQLFGAGGPLHSLVPGTFSKTVSLSQAREFERFADSSATLPSLVDGKMLQVAQLTDVQGMIVKREGNLPLIVNRVWGFGEVIFLASDLDRGPLGAWKDRPRFVATLLGWPVKPIEEAEGNKSIRHFGYFDHAGQLRSALDQFEGVWRIPFGLIVAAIVVYLLLVGPGDYFLLRKVLGRMELTWVTFPLIVGLFCVLAYGVAHFAKGKDFLVNQASLIDVDVETGELRGTAWTSVFSPRTCRADLEFTPRRQVAAADACSRPVTAWLGLPGRALGGMDPLTPPPVVWPEPYDFVDGNTRLAELPLQVWSSKSLTARWSGRMEASFECSLEERGPTPSGHLISRFEVPLADCLLVYGNWIYELGTLAPGQDFRIGATVPRRELASFLTGRKLVFDKEEDRASQRATRYSMESTDAEYILRAMTFFESAGGKPYTHLANSYQGFIDMSGLLQPNRAVLVARIAGSETVGRKSFDFPCDMQVSLSSEGVAVPVRERHTTLLRFVLPVQADER
ncbi:MAG: hypothetical protein ACYC6Y_04435 [Thermoguttaceae bacterium]